MHATQVGRFDRRLCDSVRTLHIADTEESGIPPVVEFRRVVAAAFEPLGFSFMNSFEASDAVLHFSLNNHRGHKFSLMKALSRHLDPFVDAEVASIHVTLRHPPTPTFPQGEILWVFVKKLRGQLNPEAAISAAAKRFKKDRRSVCGRP